MLKLFEGSYFRRTAAAHAEGITCGIAVPIFAGDFLNAVLVIFCGDDESHAGAIELWGNVPGESADMALVDGYYGTTADTFEFMSRRTTFRRGTGLPGIAWESGLPVVHRGSRQVGALPARRQRRQGRHQPRLRRAVPGARRATYVLAFLSALGTPIARRFEVWKPDAKREHLHLEGGFCEQGGRIVPAPRHLALGRGQGTIGQVLVTGVPGLSDAAGAEPNGWGAAAAELGLASLLVMPIVERGRLVAAAAWYF